MGYTVRENKNTERWEIVNEDGEVVGSRATEDAAEDRATQLAIQDRMHALDERVPGKQLTEAEKAKLYDDIVSKQNAGKDKNDDNGGGPNDGGGTGTGTPPPPGRKEPEKEEGKTGGRKGGYWGSRGAED